MCNGRKKDGVQCIAEADDTGYCSWLHNPVFKHYVEPDELRLSVTKAQRQNVARHCEYLDAYTTQPITDYKHVDHVVEHQLAADCISNAWRSRCDLYESNVLQDVIRLIRDGPANATSNLRGTSAYVNILKGEACKQFIEVRHTSDVVPTFTSH